MSVFAVRQESFKNVIILHSIGGFCLYASRTSVHLIGKGKQIIRDPMFVRVQDIAITQFVTDHRP